MIFSGWIETTLGDLVRGERGFQTGPFGSELRASEYLPAAPPGERPPAGVPVIMPKDLAAGAVRTATIARVAEARVARLARYRLRPGDLLVARRGKVGRWALVTAAEDGWICGTGCLRVRLGPGVEPRYLIQFLRWPATVGWLEENAVGQTMPHLNTGILKRLPVRLPPPREQRRIADALESADETARATESVIEQLSRVRDGVLRDLLRHGVDGRMPRGWAMRPLGELATFTNGHRFRVAEWSDAGLPIIRIQNLNGSRDFKRFAGYAKPEWIVEEGELLFAWAGTRGISFGPCVWPGPRGVLNQHIFRVRPRQGVATGWLYELLRRVTREIEDKAHGFSSSLVHVRRADVVGHEVPVPPYEEQRAIAERAAAIADRIAVERSGRERTLALKRGLLHDLFSETRSTEIRTAALRVPEPVHSLAAVAVV